MGREGWGICSPESEGPWQHCFNPGLQDTGLVYESHLWDVCSLQEALYLCPHKLSFDRAMGLAGELGILSAGQRQYQGQGTVWKVSVSGWERPELELPLLGGHEHSPEGAERILHTPKTAPEARLAACCQNKGHPGHQAGCALGSGSRDSRPHEGPVTLGGHRRPQTASAPRRPGGSWVREGWGLPTPCRPGWAHTACPWWCCYLIPEYQRRGRRQESTAWLHFGDIHKGGTALGRPRSKTQVCVHSQTPRGHSLGAGCLKSPNWPGP